MMPPCPRNTAQLLGMLEDALVREQQQWSPPSLGRRQGVQSDEVTAPQRNEIVQWFNQLNKKFDFYPETFFLSTTMLDRVLQTVRVRPRYLRCIGIACFYLAAKTLEEDENIPSTLRFVQVSQCGCSVAEVLRMERRVLDILKWNLHLVTPLDFLHTLHALLLSTPLLAGIPLSPGRQLALLTHRLAACMACRALLQFSPSTLALAVMSLELQQLLPTSWFTVVHVVKTHIQISDTELMRCTEMVSHVLELHPLNPAPSHASQPSPGGKLETPTKKRKVEVSVDEDDDIYDGIKRLYSDEMTCEQQARATCGGEMRQEDPNTAGLVTVPIPAT